MDSSDRRNRFLQQMHRNTMFRLQDYPGRHYNFSFSGERDIVSHTELLDANYEGAHQRLNLLTGEIEDFTANQYVRDEYGNIITRGGWKDLNLYPITPDAAGWVLINATRSANTAENVGDLTPHNIISAGNTADNVQCWRSTAAPASGAPTGIQFIQVLYKAGTSGKIYIPFTDITAGAVSSVGGTAGATEVLSQAAGALSIISDVSVGAGFRILSLTINFTNKANSLSIGAGPYSATAGQTVIIYGMSIAGAIGTGDITTKVPITNGNPGNVVTWSSLSADLTNGRGPRVTYASAPKLLTALQGASTNATGQIEWTGTPAGLPAADNQILACNTTQGLLIMKSDGSAKVNGNRYSATLASAFAANTESKIIIPYEPGEMRVIKGATSTVTDFSGTFGPVTTFGIGPGTSHITHKSLKIFKRPRITLDGMTTVYSGTVSGMLISAVAGTAFFDLLPAEVLALADGNHLIEVTDVAGKKLVGVAAAAGTGETLGSELVTNGIFSVEANWIYSGVNKWAISGGTLNAVTSSAYANARQSLPAISNNALTKRSYDVVSATVGNVYLSYGDVGVIARASDSVRSVAGTYTSYATKLSTYVYFMLNQGPSGFAGSCDNYSVKQVLTPSSNGITLVSHLGSSTQSLMYADPAFTYNQATAYGVTVKKMEA